MIEELRPPPPAPNPSSVSLGTESPVSLSGDAAGVSLGQSEKPTWLYRRPCQAPSGRGPSVPAPPLGDSEEGGLLSPLRPLGTLKKEIKRPGVASTAAWGGTCSSHKPSSWPKWQGFSMALWSLA